MSRMSLRSGQELRAKPPRRQHWWRWALGSVLALVVLAVAATGVVVKLTPGPAPLALPEDAAAAPSGQLDGTWHVTTSSVAGFRVRETVIGFSNDVTGRTGDVTGTVVVAGAQVVRATFRVSLDAITVDGKARQPQLVQSLGVTAHPAATITLTRPVTLPAGVLLRSHGHPDGGGLAHAERDRTAGDGDAIRAARRPSDRGRRIAAGRVRGLRHQGPRGYGCLRVAGQQRDG